MKTLGLGVGYSGYVRTRENDSADNKYVYPLFSGVDLRVNFTGVTSDDDDVIKIYDIFSGADIPGGGTNGGKENTQSYLALANMLGIFYKITGDLTGSFQIGNKLVVLNSTDGRESTTIKTDSSIDQFWVAAGAEYTLGSNVLLGGGLRLGVDSEGYKKTNESEQAGSMLTFGIPLRIKVVFQF
jgi:hypothetical protein